jgi:hypothetical protein
MTAMVTKTQKTATSRPISGMEMLNIC